MGFVDWVSESREDVRIHGVGGVKRSVSKAICRGAGKLGQHWNYGSSPFDESWDVLVILDACRPDYLRDVASPNDYDWATDIKTRYSAASSSPEFVEKCMAPLPHTRTESMGLVSGNPHTEMELDPSKYGAVREIGAVEWAQNGEWLPPKPVTNHAISMWRNEPVDQMVVWYMQPHAPYPGLDTSGLPERDVPWSPIEYARTNDLSNRTIRKAYRDTLERALEEVDVLSRNLDADDVILTADHAELLGEWGVLYDHPRNAPIPTLKRVPWVQLEATDSFTREPDITVEPEENSATDIEDRLEALGYR